MKMMPHSKLDAVLLNSSSHFRFISIFQLGISTPSKWHLTPGGWSCCAALHWDGGSGEAYGSAQGGHQGGPPGECLRCGFFSCLRLFFFQNEDRWCEWTVGRSSSQYSYMFSGWWYFLKGYAARSPGCAKEEASSAGEGWAGGFTQSAPFQ